MSQAPTDRRRVLAALALLAASRGAVANAPAALTWPALTTLDGRDIAPASWAGVPAVVVFFASWCAFCRRHNAHVDRLYRSVDPAALRVIGIALDRDAAALRRYVAGQGWTFPVVAGGESLRPMFTPRRVIPMTCSVGADGRLRQCIPGEMSADDVLGLAREL